MSSIVNMGKIDAGSLAFCIQDEGSTTLANEVHTELCIILVTSLIETILLLTFYNDKCVQISTLCSLSWP